MSADFRALSSAMLSFADNRRKRVRPDDRLRAVFAPAVPAIDAAIWPDRLSERLCAARAGETVEVAEAEIREAIRFHIEGLKADGLPIPAPTSIADYVET